MATGKSVWEKATGKPPSDGINGHAYGRRPRANKGRAKQLDETHGRASETLPTFDDLEAEERRRARGGR